jgi:hypothetical protein
LKNNQGPSHPCSHNSDRTTGIKNYKFISQN